ncbi:MAG: ABC transporter ATP-binding protein [Planktomarina sp.]|jgi:lipoprotein-releasing system ATP-binding protein|nr:ABC transporter [Planktomarina sp.]MDT1985466.1 ABC transporter ATP-binding protein [Planktomarina sp.]MDV3049735.1 ABC transporter ATP-binding protein [Planktomarina sp.]
MSDPILKLDQISKSYNIGRPNQVTVLRSCNLQIEPGQVVSLVAPSGAGKSTLLHIAGLLDTPDEGELNIIGKKMAHAGDKQRTHMRRTKIGFVYQFHHLLPEFTALENIMLPQQANGKSAFEARRQAIKLLDQVGLADRKDHRPGELSGGEQQRVAFCRALSNSPKLLLADEPTGNLDQETSEHVFGILMELVHSTGMAALIATHNLHLASRMDRNVVLDKGKVT